MQLHGFFICQIEKPSDICPAAYYYLLFPPPFLNSALNMYTIP